MKIITNIIIGLTFFNSIILGYGGPLPAPPLFKAKNVGAVYQPPLVVGNNQSAIYAQISYVAASELDGRIDLEGASTNLNGLIDGKNFEWQTPTTLFNFGLSTALSENAAFVFDLGLNQTGSLKISGFEIGFNGLMIREENHKVRLGVGVNIHPTDFLWYQSSNPPEKYGRIDYDPFLSITYNTSYNNWLFNPFSQVSYSLQTLLDDNGVYKNVNVFILTAGFTYNLGGDKLINLGLTYSDVSGIENSKSYLLTPLLQFSYLFGNRE